MIGRRVAEQRLRGELAERDDHPRPDRRDLRAQERLAGLDLVGLRVAVARRAALHDVRDVDLLAAEAHRLDHLREELARLADEGLALAILVRAGTLARRTSARRAGFPTPKTSVVRAAGELAARAVAELVADREQGRAARSLARRGERPRAATCAIGREPSGRRTRAPFVAAGGGAGRAGRCATAPIGRSAAAAFPPRRPRLREEAAIPGVTSVTPAAASQLRWRNALRAATSSRPGAPPCTSSLTRPPPREKSRTPDCGARTPKPRIPHSMRLQRLLLTLPLAAIAVAVLARPDGRAGVGTARAPQLLGPGAREPRRGAHRAPPRAPGLRRRVPVRLARGGHRRGQEHGEVPVPLSQLARRLQRVQAGEARGGAGVLARLPLAPLGRHRRAQLLRAVQDGLVVPQDLHAPRVLGAALRPAHGSRSLEARASGLDPFAQAARLVPREGIAAGVGHPLRRLAPALPGARGERADEPVPSRLAARARPRAEPRPRARPRRRDQRPRRPGHPRHAQRRGALGGGARGRDRRAQHPARQRSPQAAQAADRPPASSCRARRAEIAGETRESFREAISGKLVLPHSLARLAA